ncbi:MAG: hypothetical protein WC492_04215 [Candidatus Micrarchaeia archaeon]
MSTVQIPPANQTTPANKGTVIGQAGNAQAGNAQTGNAQTGRRNKIHSICDYAKENGLVKKDFFTKCKPLKDMSYLIPKTACKNDRLDISPDLSALVLTQFDEFGMPVAQQFVEVSPKVMEFVISYSIYNSQKSDFAPLFL